MTERKARAKEAEIRVRTRMGDSRFLRFAGEMTARKARTTTTAKMKQIPFGNDRKKGKCPRCGIN